MAVFKWGDRGAIGKPVMEWRSETKGKTALSAGILAIEVSVIGCDR